jgi:hypothetical protein
MGVDTEMFKKIGLAVALVTISALPVMAQATCTAPVAPATVDGSTVTKEALIAAIAGVKAFIASSDTYQQCLDADLKAQKAQATTDKKMFDPKIEADVIAKAGANQKEKEKAGADINTAVAAYKKLHP